MNTLDQKMIFVTGSSRSGTTLLSFVLRSHPEIFGFKELQYFGQAWDPHRDGRCFSRAKAIAAAALIYARQELGIIESKIYSRHRDQAISLLDRLDASGLDPAVIFAAAVNELTQAANKHIACEQTPRNIFYAQALLGIYPAAHIIHIVRDPRAVMASQKMRWRLRVLASESSKVTRYQSLRVWVNYHPYTIARLWNRATSDALALSEHPRVSLVTYEDLVRDPEATVRHLCGRVGIDYDERMLDVNQVNSSHQSATGGARKGFHADAIDKWVHALSPTEVSIAERQCAQLMRSFGYQTGAAPPITVTGQIGSRLSYLAHLAGVLLVNPGRASVQWRALLRSRTD